MDDLISRQAVLQICREKIWNGADDYEPISSRGIAERVKAMPSVQPNLQPACNNLATDTISRQAALDAMKEAFNPSITNFVKAKMAIDNLPSAQPEKRTEERTETHECDLISRQDFDKFLEDAEKEAAKYRKYVFASALNTIRGNLRNFPSAQPKSKERTAESPQNVPKEDLISRKAAIDAICDNCDAVEASCPHYPCGRYVAVEKLPSAQPERLTDDDFETIRIHLNAYKEKLCNQRRWKEADEYQRIIDRFMAFAPAQPERKKGEWISKGYGEYRCSSCRNIIDLDDEILMSIKMFDYCPVCGADMRGRQNETNWR